MRPSVALIALDTNIIVRYLTRDDALQFQQAKRLVEKNDIFVPLTVIIEVEWVLRSSYRYTKSTTQEAIRSLIGLPGVTLQDAGSIVQALDWMDNGIDFADALHLSLSANCSDFYTFDRAFAKSAVPVVSVKIRIPSEI